MKEGWNGSTQQDGKWRLINANQDLEVALANTKKREKKLTQKRTSLIDTYKKNRKEVREEKKILALKEGDFESYLEAVEKMKDKPEFVQVFLRLYHVCAILLRNLRFRASFLISTSRLPAVTSSCDVCVCVCVCVCVSFVSARRRGGSRALTQVRSSRSPRQTINNDEA